MEKKKAIELIKLEVLESLSLQDSEALKAAKQNDKDFPWKELGEYQNLAALLSTTLKIETPVQGLKDEIVLRLASSLYEDTKSVEDTARDEEAKVVKELESELIEIESELEGKVKAPGDFLPLKDPDLSQLHIFYEDDAFKSKSFKEKEKEKEKKKEKEKVQEPKLQVEKETELIVEYEQTDTPDKEYSKPSYETNIGSLQKNLKRSLFISGGLFVITVVLIAFIFFKLLGENGNEQIKTDATEKILLAEKNKVDPPEETQVTIPVGDIQKVEDRETSRLSETKVKETPLKEETKNKQSGPPPLPKSPTPIEAPLITGTQNSESNNVETDNERREETLLSPPEEVKKVLEEPTYFVAVEDMPEPLGGLKGIQEKIVYPEIAKRMGVEGKVHVRAFVDESGNVTDVQIIKGIGAGCDEAALDAVLKTKFKPGKQRGKPVKVQVTIPINFRL